MDFESGARNISAITREEEEEALFFSLSLSLFYKKKKTRMTVSGVNYVVWSVRVLFPSRQCV